MLNEIQAKYREQIDAEFYAALFAEPTTKESNLREMIRYHYDTGGKRIRPLSVAFAAEQEWASQQRSSQCSSNDSQPISAEEEKKQKIMSFAVAVEMIHNATLIHDDLQDGDEVRRGQPTLWKRFSPEQAINCGDLLFFTALRTIQSGTYSPAVSLALQALLTEKTELVIEGQGEEFRLKQGLQDKGALPSPTDYERMVLGKTGALFSMPLLGGAIIAGASQYSLTKLTRGASALGHAFQVQDDYIDIWGEKGRDQCATDIAEGKLSFPVIMTFESFKDSFVAEPDQKRFVNIIAKEREATSLGEIDWAVGLMNQLGIQEQVRQRFFRFQSEFDETGYWQDMLQSLFDRIAEKVL